MTVLDPGPPDFCVFCGSEDVELYDDQGGWQVVCEHCGSTGPHIATLTGNDAEWRKLEAVRRWNTRLKRKAKR